MRQAVPRIECTCKVCKTVFYKRQKEIDGGRGVYCCRKCQLSDRKNAIPRGENHYRFKGGNQIVKCSYCEKEIERKYYESNKYKYFFCCTECESKFYSEKYSGENHPQYKGGICCDGYHFSFKNPENRNRVRQLFKNTCLICGKVHKEGDENLIVHHINPEHKAYEFDKAKYVCLCRSCHSTIHNNKESLEYWTEYFNILINDWMGGICYI